MAALRAHDTALAWENRSEKRKESHPKWELCEKGVYDTVANIHIYRRSKMMGRAGRSGADYERG